MELSKIAEIISALGLQNETRLSLVDLSLFTAAHVPPFAPDVPALIVCQPGTNPGLTVKALSIVYPLNFQIKILTPTWQVQDTQIERLDGQECLAVLVPVLSPGSSLEAFQEIIAHLRAPEDGCPWDKEQTHLSLRKHLLEESYETLSAMDEQDPLKMREEFGDLLLQIVLNAQIGSETGGFSMAEILQGIYDKIVRRHPHVFGDVQVDGVGNVLSNWEQIKAGERKQQGYHEKGILDGLPPALPALTQAQEFQDRAARVGFDWPEISGVLEKVKEEIEEVKAAANPVELTDELGDLFFALVNLARWKKIDAEAALRGASLKFKTRFRYIEERARQQKRSMQELSLAEMDELWNEAKRATRSL